MGQGSNILNQRRDIFAEWLVKDSEDIDVFKIDHGPVKRPVLNSGFWLKSNFNTLMKVRCSGTFEVGLSL